jgi:hypothetical protein
VVAVLVASCVMGGRSIADTAREQMWAHFAQSAHLELSTAMGDAAAARNAARDILATESMTGIPPEAQADLAALHQRAEDVLAANDLQALTLATAGIGAACGTCHSTHGVGPTFVSVAPPPDADDVDHMVEHLWAADRMWEGLIIPSTQHWEAGARVLADHSVPMELRPPGTPGLGVRLKSLGLDALQDRDAAGRVERYAEILETCAGCHLAAGVG